jgi:hypothetical protein
VHLLGKRPVGGMNRRASAAFLPSGFHGLQFYLYFR